MKFFSVIVTCCVFFGIAFYENSFARDRISMKGSSAIFPYAKIISENFKEDFPDFKTPFVESGGTSAGLKEFCKGVGEDTIDIVNSSRKMSVAEFNECKKKGVSDIREIKIGYDAVVLAFNKSLSNLSLTIEDLYKALAAKLVVNGILTSNPFQKWSDIRSDLPEVQISIYIPSEKHGTREVLEEKILKEGCLRSKNFANIKKLLNHDDLKSNMACIAIRKDGAAIEVDGDYPETLMHIKANKNVFGFLGLSFYKNNTDILSVVAIDGVVPSMQTVFSREYPIVRPFIFYVKNKHLGNIIGLKEYVAFMISDQIMASDSALVRYGLIPASDYERKSIQNDIKMRDLSEINTLKRVCIG
ncbi:PstS family phosphate ABC transporter substrate-binding protein [Candidatus Liberibacter sp.]|uniref:PstS family phosphate ABC transporter substrate-binding protein n=1 Tax=Candidatus Liberibacter sp. TaxID=34022 RepID=UPI0015F75DF6|nr:substrate-binding domain-containing protein [Candidatus Liberibacter sp.]MBA5723951.1 substrate-binding domain-containing protein [Candidatus Liberibacter sp.]